MARLAVAVAATLLAAAPATAHVAGARVVGVQAPRAANPGATIPVTARVHGRDGATVSFWLTAGRAARRAGARRLLAVRARGGQASGAPVLSPLTSLGPRRVLACLGSRCAASTPMVVRSAPASSEDLVDAALAAHRLSPDRAILYRVYAVTGDPRLPARYRGDLVPMRGEDAFQQAEQALPHLPRSLQRRLLPFLEPPMIGPGSHKRSPARGHGRRTLASAAAAAPQLGFCQQYDPIDEESWQIAFTRSFWGREHYAIPWRTLVSPDGHVRFWYDADVPYTGANARELARYVPRIWATYKRIMGREPLSDAGAGCFWGTDGRYDVYLLPSDEQGTLYGAQTITYPPKCSATPAFTTVRGRLFPWALAHELFHAFQDAFRTARPHCAEYNWIAEGSADWAAHVVFPEIHPEYPDEHGFLQDTQTAPPNWNGGQGSYATWPLWLELAQLYGDQTIRSIFMHMGDADPVHAVDEAIPGGWRTQWPIFTRAAYNRDPYKPFVQWDGLTDAPDVVPLAVALNGRQKATFNVPADAARGAGFEPALYGLGRAYTEIDLASDVGSVHLSNPHLGDPNWSMQAYLRFDDGHTEYRDLSGSDHLDLCRSDPSEDVDGIVLMMANSQIPNASDENLATPRPQLTARADCNHYYKVTAFSAALNYHANYPLNRYQGDTCSVTGAETYTISSRDSGQPTDGSTSDVLGYIGAPGHIDGGTVSYSDPCNYPSASDDPCQSTVNPGDSTLSVQISHNPGDASATVGFLAYERTLDGDIFCHDRFGDDWVAGDDSWVNAQVPWSELTGTQPFTVTASDSINDGSRSVARQISMTLQPVDVDGSPLPSG